MRRLLAPLLALAMGPAAGVAAQATDPPRTPSWLARRIETAFASATGGTLEIGSIDVDWTALTANVSDVTLTIPAEGAPPLTASLAQGRIRLAWSSLAGIAAGDIRITDVSARGATFSCSREWIDAFTPRPSSGESSVAIQVDHLDLQDSTAEYVDAGAHTRVVTHSMHFLGDWSTSRRLLVGAVDAGVEVDAPLFGRTWPATVHGGLRWGGGRLEIFNATGSGPGAEGELQGTVTWGAGVSFTAEGRARADLGAMSPYLPEGLPLSGQLAGPVQIVFAGGAPVRVVVQADTTDLRIGPIVTEKARALVTVRPGHLDVDQLSASGYGGRFEGRVGLTFGAPVLLDTSLTGRGADLSRLIALSGQRLPVASRGDVKIAIRGEAGHAASWNGEVAFDASPDPSLPGVPARGSGKVAFGTGRVRIDAPELKLAGATMSLDVATRLAVTPEPLELTIAGSTEDARATQEAALRFLRALNVPDNPYTIEPLEGRGTFRASLTAEGKQTVLDLRFDLTQGSYSGEAFETARLSIHSDASGLTLRDVDVTGEGTELSGNARFDGATGRLDAVDLRAESLGLARILKRAGAAAQADGRIDVALAGDRRDGVFAAQGKIAGRGIILGKEIFDSIEAPVRVEDDRLILDGIDIRGAGLAIAARVIYDLTQREASVDVLSSRIDVAENRSLAEAGFIASGRLQAAGSFTVTKDGPEGLLQIGAAGLVVDTGRNGLRDVRLGDLDGTATLSRSGIAVSVRSVPEAKWTLESFVGFDSSLPVSAVLYFEDLVVGAGGAFGESVDLRLRGQVQAEGDLTEPKALEVNGAFDDLIARFGPHVLHAAEPFPLRLDAGTFVLGPAHLHGDAADVSVFGEGGIERGDVSGYLRGNLDLGIVSSFWGDLRGSGPAEVDATLSGTIDTPDLQGRVAVHGGRLRLIGTPQSLESIDAEARFAGQTLTLASFHALQGGGEIDATGAIEFNGVFPASYHATFEGANVSAKYPEGFKGTYDGRITLTGTPKKAAISGRIDVIRGLYNKDFDIGLFGATHREFEPESESALPVSVALDVDVVAAGNVFLRNDLARVEASGQLHVGGELARPEITGRMALVPGGTVRYRDVDYTIDYGTLEQTDPKRVNPFVEFRGRTRVSDYDITLHVEGTIDKFEYELTSTPPLASQDIISLLVTGRTLDTLSGATSASALPGDMAAYYFAGLLSSAFGKQIQSTFGIDQLEITPQLLKGSSDPTARVTVGKRVSDTVKILFSQDIGTAQKQTYSVSWDASRRVRLLAFSDTDTGIGGEIQYSRQFGGTPSAFRAPQGGTSRGADAEASRAVGSVSAQDVAGTARPDLVKKSKVRPGEAFDRGRMLQGAERIRTTLVKQGFIQAGIRAEESDDPGKPGTVAIVYRVSPGPKVKVEIVMTGGGTKRSLKKAFRQLSGETTYTADFWDEAAKVLSDQLQESGYYAADVTWRAEDTDSGRSVKILVDRGKPVRLKALRFHGNVAMPTLRIEKVVTSLKAKTLGKRLLRPGTLTADLGAVRALYRDEGFTRVHISDPVIALAATGDSAEVDVTIDEGTKFSIGNVSFDGSSIVPESDMRSWAGLATGQIFSPRRLAEAEQTLRDRLDGMGYPDVTVESRVGFVEATVDVAFEVHTGAKKTVEDIAIAGNRVTKNRTIASALTFGRGDLASKQSFLKSQQQLYRTGLFSNVRLSAEPVGGADATGQKVTVKVEEAPPLALGLGVGYDSEDGPRASLLFGYSNLGGRNVALTLQSRVSSKDNQELLTLRRRAVFGGRIDSLGSLLYEKTLETGFTERRRAASIRFEQKPKPRWIRFVRYTLQQVDIEDITDAQAALDQIFEDKLSSIRLGDVGVGLVRDTRDDAFLPTRGGYGSIEGSVFGRPLGSEATFVKLFVRGSWTATFKRGSRFASFLRIGAAYPFADTDLVPLSERFFAGGSSTMRGFATDSVGGLVVSGFNAGGEALIILNEEWHFPIWKSLRGELFLDAGNVYEKVSNFNPTELRSSAGTGLRLDTPIGPIRIEYGWKLDRKEGESPGELIFAIGTVF